MHRCLRVLEVAGRIANHLDAEDALNLAVTCRTLLEPGLDRVWRNIDSFEPLIACLSEDLLRRNELEVEDGADMELFVSTRPQPGYHIGQVLTYTAHRHLLVTQGLRT